MTGSNTTSQQQHENNLLNDVKEASADKLTEVVKDVEHLTEEGLGGRLRAGRAWLDKQKTKIRATLYWCFCGVILILMIVSAYYLVTLVNSHMKVVLASPELVKELLGKIWDTVLIVLATLFIEHASSKKE